eukprot:SAG31_NODE_3459_length_4250_cov_1.437244_3_plen_139_part_00
MGSQRCTRRTLPQLDIAERMQVLADKVAEDRAKEAVEDAVWEVEHRTWQKHMAELRGTRSRTGKGATLARVASVGTRIAEDRAKERAEEALWDAEHRSWQVQIGEVKLSPSTGAAAIFTPPDPPAMMRNIEGGDPAFK